MSLTPEEVAMLEGQQADPGTPPAGDPPVIPPVVPPGDPIIPEGFVNWKEAFPEYESPDIIKEKLTNLSQFETQKTEWENQRTTWSQKEKEYSDKILTLSSAKLPGETDELYRIRKINESQPDKFDMAKKFYLGNMSDFDLVKEGMRLTPGLDKFSDDELNNFLSDKYTLTMEGVDPEDSDAVAARQRLISQNKINLSIEAASAKERIMNSFGKIEIPKPKTEEEIKVESEKRVTEWMSEWKPVFDGIRNNKVELSIPFDKDPKNGAVVIEIPADLKNKYIQDYGQALYLNGAKTDGNSQDSVTEFVRKKYIVENFSSIAALISESSAKSAREMSDEQWMKISYNVRKPGSATPPPADGAKPNPNLEELNRVFGQK